MHGRNKYSCQVSSLMQHVRGKLGEKHTHTRTKQSMRRYLAGYSMFCCSTKRKQQSFSSLYPYLRGSVLSSCSPVEASYICICCVHVGLDLGRAGNFPGARGDGRLLAGAGPVAAGVLDAATGTSGILSAHILSRPPVPVPSVFSVRPVSSTPLAHRAGISVRPHPLPAGLWRCCLLLSLLSFPGALTRPPAFVSALCGNSLLPVSCVLPLMLPVLPFQSGNIGLLASWAPGALRLFWVPWMHCRISLLLGTFPWTGGARVSLPLGFSLLDHVLLGSTVALLCFSVAQGLLHLVSPAFSNSSGTAGLGVAPGSLSGVAAGAGGTFLVVVEKLLFSWAAGLPTVLLSIIRWPRCPEVLFRELNRCRSFGRRWRPFWGREKDGGRRSWRQLVIGCREPGKACCRNNCFVFWTWETDSR